MSDDALVMSLIEKIKQVQDAAANDAGSLGPAVKMSVQLSESLRWLEHDEMRVPLVTVTMLGASGVGKSSLFNALIEKPGASPVSGGERCYTQQPYIAVSTRDQPLLRVPEGVAPHYVPSELPSVALIDTPDIDGFLEKNWVVTRAMVQQCDIVLYVTMPERRADFDVTEEVRRWAVLKRWLFVLNRVDTARSCIDDVRKDFDKRLRGLGFEPDDACRFLVSANEPGGTDFRRLQATILNMRLATSAEHLRLDGFLGYVQQAVGQENLGPLREKVEVLRNEEKDLSDQVRRVYQENLGRPLARDAFRIVVREQAWRYLGERIGWLMALAIWLRCRVSVVFAAFQLSRVGLGRLSAMNLGRAMISVIVAVIQGAIPLRRIVVALGPEYRQKLDAIRVDARRFLEDHRLAGLCPQSESHAAAEVAPGESTKSEGTPGPAGVADKLLKHLSAGLGDEELVEHLQTDVDSLAQATAARVGRAWVSIVANLLPTLIVAHIFWRIGWGWWTER